MLDHEEAQSTVAFEDVENALDAAMEIVTEKLRLKRIRDIQQMIADGKNKSDIALHLNKSERWLNHFLDTHMGGLRLSPGPKTSPRLDQYRKCAAAGMTRKETAAHMNTALQTVNSMAFKYGIHFISGYRSAHERSVECEAKYRACAERGLTAEQTATECGVTVRTVKKAGARYGLKFTKPKPPEMTPSEKMEADAKAIRDRQKVAYK